MTVCCSTGGVYVPDYLLAKHKNFLESPLVAWQQLRAKKLWYLVV